MSYLDKVQNLINHDYHRVDYWHAFCYYRSSDPVIDIFKHPTCVIHSIFSSARKNALITPSQETLSKNRAAHSISTLLLGNIIGNGLLGNKNINLDPAFLRVNWDYYSFSYIWSLTCLYHDFGYIIEQDNELCQEFTSSVPQNDRLYNQTETLLQKIDEKLHIELSLLRYKHYSQPRLLSKHYQLYPKCNLTLELSKAYLSINSPIFFKRQALKVPHYSKTTIRNYFAYRAFANKEHACLDHGIIGGLLFFDNIIKSYAQAYLEEKEYHQDISMEHFTTNALTFSFNQLPVFAYISDCISSHNIWTVPSSSNQFERYSNLYNTYHLNHLVGNKIKKINFHQNPLLFLLAITDSLEPYKILNRDHNQSFDNKIYSEDDVINAFSNFDIVATPEKITVSVNDIYAKQFAAAISDLCEWLDVSYDTVPPSKPKNGWSQFEIRINSAS